MGYKLAEPASFEENILSDKRLSTSREGNLEPLGAPNHEERSCSISFTSFCLIQACLISLYIFFATVVMSDLGNRPSGNSQHEISTYCKSRHHGPFQTSVIKLTRLSAPARNTVQYELKFFDMAGRSAYAGEPSPELDTAWHELLKRSLNPPSPPNRNSANHSSADSPIRIAASELARANRSNGVELSDEEGGYWGMLSVYHQLHCIGSAHLGPRIENNWLIEGVETVEMGIISVVLRA